MYRGSSFLLQKDYRIHLGVVEEVLNLRHSVLNGLSFDDFSFGGEKEVTEALFDLLNRVKACYKDSTTQRGAVHVTDTLATKILLGTLGCIPAYDRFFIMGLKARALSFSNKTNFREMMAFCSDHREEFQQAQVDVSRHGLEYPMMKIIDMYFWRLGEEIDGGLKAVGINEETRALFNQQI
jgi:hypothetical protein